MKDAEYLRAEYNKRFSGPAENWTTEDLRRCGRLAGRIMRWAYFRNGNGLKMLDVGCATGFFTKAFSLKGFNATGLDYSEVAISKARTMHPGCTFIHGDGFNPKIDSEFDLIFCRGFSGANTHELNKVTDWSDKYIDLLTETGVFVFSYSTDFTGREAENETVNWSPDEIKEFTGKVKGKHIKTRIYYEYFIISRLLFIFKGWISRKPVKKYFYIFFSR